MLKMLLDETTTINQLVEACKIYLSSELFFTEFEPLAFFNHIFYHLPGFLLTH